MLPVAGEIADGINALIYTARGDYFNAGLSLAAMVPIAGNAVTGVKWGNRIGKMFHKHHVIPNQIYKKYAKDFGAIGFKQNGGMNLKKLPTPFHGNHPAYNRRVSNSINELIRKDNLNIKSITDLQHELRQEINDIYLDGGILKLNDFYKTK